MIKNIVFDVNGVLFSFNPGKLFKKTRMTPSGMLWIIRAGRSEQFRELNRGIYASKRDMIEKNPDFFPSSEKYAWDVFSERWNESFFENRAAIELLRELAPDYHIYILSNVDPDEKVNIMKTSFYEMADGSVFSCDTGYIKPEIEIYEIFLKKYALIPEECLFIDDKSKNLRTAEQLNFHTVKFITAGQTRHAIRKKLKKG